MDMRRGRIQPDELLRRFREAEDDAEARKHRDRLINEHADPVIKRILRKEFRIPFNHATPSTPQEEAAENVRTDAIIRLTKTLDDIRANPHRDGIDDFLDYVGGITYNACKDYWRKEQRSPSVQSESELIPEGDDDGGGYGIEDVPDPGPVSSEAIIDAISQQEFVVPQVWKEICRLQREQRKPLLLNAPWAIGGKDNGLDLFISAGISFGQVAEALDITIEELANLWNEIPLEDTTISQRFGIVPRQRVINLRQRALERLRRWWKRLMGDK